MITFGTTMSRLAASLSVENCGRSGGLDVIPIHSGRDAIESVRARCNSYRRIIGVGFFGGIGSLVEVGDILVPCQALYLREVPRGEWTPNEQLTTTLLREAKRLAPTHTGVVVTAPKAVAGVSRRVLSLRARGALGVDMETAHLFAGFGAASVAALLVCSDHVIHAPLAKTKPRADRHLPLTEQSRSVAQRAFLMAVRLLSESGGAW